MLDGFMSQRIIAGTTTSDEQGFFNISGYRGDELSVVPEKMGYGFASTNGYARYFQDFPARQIHHPDPRHPIVIRMWKAQGLEPLVHIDQRYKLPSTNDWVTFDLVQKTNVVNGGDFRMRIERLAGVLAPTNMPVWRVEFEAVDGGIIESKGSEAITYFAPESGYQTNLTLSNIDPLPVSGADALGTGFYIKSRNGQVYSKVYVRVLLNMSIDERISIEFQGFANTNSSRNWEAAPNLMKRTD